MYEALFADLASGKRRTLVADWFGTLLQAGALALLAVLSWAVTTGRLGVFRHAYDDTPSGAKEDA